MRDRLNSLLRVLILLIPLTCFMLYADEPQGVIQIDGLAAIVGDIPILQSDVETRALELAVYQKADVMKDKSIIEKLKKQAFEMLLQHNMFIMAAREDSTINVADTEVIERLNEQLDGLKKEYPETKDQEAFLKSHGFKNKEEYIKMYKKEVEDALYMQAYTRRYISSKVNVTNQEIMDFYAKNKDKQEMKQEQYRIGYFVVNIAPSKEEQDRVDMLKHRILQELTKGVGFTELAKEHSQGPNRANGGDLGVVTDGMDPFLFLQIKDLRNGQVSKWIYWKGSWWLFKVTDRIEDTIRVSVILLKPQPVAGAREKAKELIDKALSEYKANKPWERIISEYSDNKQVDLGWLTKESMESQKLPDALLYMKIGDTTDIDTGETALQFYTLLGKEVRNCSLEQIYDRIRGYLRNQKMQKIVDRRIEALKKQIYIKAFPPYDKYVK
jgi:parvulin-like peptidyl-prolyl isomerase